MNGEMAKPDPVRMVYVGSPLLDISAKCEQDLLDKYALKQDDCVRAGSVHDSLFKSLFDSPESRLSAGGSSQNTARIAKWVLKDKGEIYFTGCTGHDEYQAWMRKKLFSEGVVPLYVEISLEPTGVCACLLNADDKRSLCANLGAGALFAAEHLELDLVKDHLSSAHCVFVEGYFVGHSPDAVLALAHKCRSDQVFSLSLSAEYVCHSHTEALTKVIPDVDILFGNEAEVKAFARALGGNDQVTVEESVRMIRQLPKPGRSRPQIVVTTCGSNPVIVDDGSNDLRKFGVPKDVKAVDSVGCGDALAGAFLATYIRTRDIELAIQDGIQAAVVILQVAGCDIPTSKSLKLEK